MKRKNRKAGRESILKSGFAAAEAQQAHGTGTKLSVAELQAEGNALE